MAIRRACAFLAAAFPCAVNAAPLDDLIKPGADNAACFTRVYDSVHLKAHPKQNVTSMTVWLRYEKSAPYSPSAGLGVSLAIVQRGDPQALYSDGGCAWGAHANRDTSDHRL